VIYADAITTVSPRYAREITTPEFGEQLDGVIRRVRTF
jgi:starch synthase